MKIRDVLDYVMELKEPAFSEKTLLRWLNQIEAEIQTEILLIAEKDIVRYTMDDMETELIAPAPFDKLYEDYLIWRIHEAQEEAERANNAQAVFNKTYVAYSIFVCETINPGLGKAEKMRYYLSAYGIAQKHGFAGTEEEWLESLKGQRGQAGPQGLPGAGIEVEYEKKTGTVKVKNLGGSGNNPGTGADITGDLIIEKLGYTPAKEEDLNKKVSLPESGNGTDGQYAVSDGAGGIRWKTGGEGSFDGEITADEIEEALGYAPAKPINVFSVKNFGTKTDGETDDSGAIQTAVDACNEAGGGTVYFPAGTYLIETAITIHSNMRLQGEPGAKLLRNSAKTGSLITASGVSNVIMEGLTLDGGAGRSGLSYLINLENATDFSVRNCNVIGNYKTKSHTGAGVCIEGGSNLTVDGCSFNMDSLGNSSAIGVSSQGDVNKAYVTNCYFENTYACFGGKETTDMFFGYNKIKNCFAGVLGYGTDGVYIGRACHNVMYTEGNVANTATNLYTYKTVYGFGNLANGESYVRDSGDNNKLTLPKDSYGKPINGTAGQYAVSDGKGGITWAAGTQTDVEEVVDAVLNALPTWTGGSY